jgi:hypothetical protein
MGPLTSRIWRLAQGCASYSLITCSRLAQLQSVFKGNIHQPGVPGLAPFETRETCRRENGRYREILVLACHGVHHRAAIIVDSGAMAQVQGRAFTCSLSCIRREAADRSAGGLVTMGLVHQKGRM